MCYFHAFVVSGCGGGKMAENVEESRELGCVFAEIPDIQVVVTGFSKMLRALRKMTNKKGQKTTI